MNSKEIKFTPSEIKSTIYTLRAKSELKPEYLTDLTFIAEGVDIYCDTRTW